MKNNLWKELHGAAPLKNYTKANKPVFTKPTNTNKKG